MDDKKIAWSGWETVRLIGRGSFGSVYEIQRDVLGDVEKAALKVISIPQNASDVDDMYSDGYDEESITSTFQSHLKSIVAEYSLMRKMNGCANVVNCDDIRYVQHDNGIGWDIFIKMELLTPLTKALPAQVSEEAVVKIAKDLCNALIVCKEYNVIHRDIKPQNIFVSQFGDYKLGDFGIAKTVEKTMGGTKIGTYKYMAPEVYNNQPYGQSADIYSVGLVLYWMLNERRMPFMPLPPAKLSAGMEEESRLRRFSGEELPAPKNGSEELKRIVLKVCAYDPKDRYSSAAEMLADLNRLGQPQQNVVAPIAPESTGEKTVEQEEHKTEEPELHEQSKQEVKHEEVPAPEKKTEVPPEQNTDPSPKADVSVDKKRGGKTLISLLLCIVAGIFLVFFMGGKGETQHQQPSDLAETVFQKSEGVEYKVAMITDYGDINDQAFNQTTWEAVQKFGLDYNVETKYYKPASNDTACRVACVELAIAEGYNVIIMPGQVFGATVAQVSGNYPDVKFIILDAFWDDMLEAGVALKGESYDYNPDNWNLTEYVYINNVHCVIYQEELAGYMAGFAAVKLGYTKLGFLGSMAIPDVLRYGYGFVQGADAAAAELGINIEMNYIYAGQFFGDAEITAVMEAWYDTGTEVVFACGGIYTSAAEAAKKYGGKVIGADTDQAPMIDSWYGDGITLTSAMKGLATTTTDALYNIIIEGWWEVYAGCCNLQGLVSGDDPSRNYVQLGTTQYREGAFSEVDYAALIKALYEGDLKVSDDISTEPAVTNTTVHYQGNIKG